MFEECQAKFPTTYLNDEVKRYTMILADALWYLNGHFGGLQEKASHIPDIVAIIHCHFKIQNRNKICPSAT